MMSWEREGRISYESWSKAVNAEKKQQTFKFVLPKSRLLDGLRTYGTALPGGNT